MCIIVAKNRNLPMPSERALRNCFEYNSDGAGIMLAAKGKVWGFKGLMTFDAFTDKLKKLSQRFGDLDRLAVVLHFRIGTHGSNVPENTHPFPLSTDYPDLRSLEWVAEQGVAHNGIISACGYHKDIRAENVSDTMVFVKRVIAPIAKNIRITKRSDVLEGLGIMAGSKLAFLDGKGIIKTAGSFIREDDILYSNDSYEDPKPYIRTTYAYSKGRWSRADDYEDEDDYKPYSVPSGSYGTKASDYKRYIRLPKHQELEYKQELADEYGLLTEIDGVVIEAYNVTIVLDDDHAFNEADGNIYVWDSTLLDWAELYGADEYQILENENESKEEMKE